MAGDAPGKAPAAFRTIGEVAAETGLAPHVLRYWETRFPQLRPLQRSGNRRYYRTEDVVLIRRIDGLLNREGYTMRGVQQVLAGRTPAEGAADADTMLSALRAIHGLLTAALAADAG